MNVFYPALLLIFLICLFFGCIRLRRWRLDARRRARFDHWMAQMQRPHKPPPVIRGL